jgi:hypothetical protein
MSLVQSYSFDGSFESFSLIMRDADAGNLAARHALDLYRQYQLLSRDVRRTKQLPSRSYGAGGSYGVGDDWTIAGNPSTAQLKQLQGELDKMFPKPKTEIAPHVHCDVTGCTEKKKPYAPPGVHITSHTRIGDEVRNTYLDHLGAKFSDGSMDQAEYDARANAAFRARTKEELESLIQDLPAIEKKPDVIVLEKKGLSYSPAMKSADILVVVACVLTFIPAIAHAATVIFLVAVMTWLAVWLTASGRSFLRRFAKEMKG